MRETCICEQPTRSAISDCSRSSWKRRRRISRARSSRIAGQALERHAGLDAVELLVVGADQVAGGGRVVLLVVHGRVERAHERPSVACSASTISSGARSRRSARSATVGERPSSPQSVSRASSTREAELLQVARRAHVPGGVAEVAAQLAEDRRDGVGGEREAAVGVPAVDGLDEADGGDLDQVVERLGRAAVAQREGAGERHVALDQHLACMASPVRCCCIRRLSSRWRLARSWVPPLRGVERTGAVGTASGAGIVTIPCPTRVQRLLKAVAPAACPGSDLGVRRRPACAGGAATRCCGRG